MLEDLSFAFRQMRRSPGFSAAVVITLALAIGVNTAVFSLLDGFLLRRLPYPQPDRLAVLMHHEESRRNPARSEEDDSSDRGAWDAIRHNIPSVMAAIAGQAFGGTEGVNLEASAAQGGAVRYVHSASVSAHYFQVLGIQPVLGRGFTEDEDRPGAGKAVVISFNLWRAAFHQDPHILGQAIDLKGAPYIVVGVLPQGAVMPNPAELWTPLMPDDPDGPCIGANCMILVRLKPGANWDEVRAQLAHLPPPRSVDLQRDKAWYYLSSVHFDAGSAMRAPTQALMLAVGFILLIACANLAGLMLARIHRRTPEIATRLALGASRARVLRQLWIENLVLALFGGTAGVGLALLLFPVLRRMLPAEMTPIGGFSLDGRVLAFAVGVSLLTSLLFGALPALETRHLDLRSAIASGTRSVAGGSSRVRQWLIGAEVALTVILLAASGLLIRTIVHLETLPPGFDPTNVMTAQASLDEVRYHDPAAFQRLLRESTAAMQRIPGVESAAVALSVPYDTFINDYVEARDGRLAGTGDSSSFDYVTPQYFSTLRIRILAGRAFNESDTTDSQRVAIVNTAFGRSFFGDANPIGRHFGRGKRIMTIVGVVPDVLDQTRATADAPPLADEPIYYIPYTQFPADGLTLIHMWVQPSWIVRTRGPVGGLTGRMQHALADADPGLPFSGFYSMQEVLDQQLQTQRIEVLLLSTLAGLALLLSAIGIYALVSNLVVQRTREIGIRIALGSTLGEAMRHTAASGILASCAGVLAGLGGSFLALRVMKSVIYGVGVYDPVTLATVPLLLVAIAAAASLLPALRIAHIDPAVTLRAE